MNKELLQQALECFEEIILHNDQHVSTANKGAELLCAAIAQPEHPTKPVAWWIPKAEQFCLPDKDGSRPFANAWEPLYASPPIAQPVPIEGDAKDAGFIQKTNIEYAAWCSTYYQADTLDERGMKSLHGLWAWQEQELRSAIAKPATVQGEPVAEGDAKDAERLDWLQSQTEAYGFQDIHEGNRWMIDGPFMFVRDALDAAIVSQKAKS